MPGIKNTFQAAQDRIRFFFGQMDYAPITAVSAKSGEGVDVLLNTALRMYGQLLKRVDTAALNHALEGWLEEYPPPSGRQARFKVKYAVQLSANPVRFAFFVSRKQAVGEPYIAFLRNRIRRDLGFSLVPVEIDVRSSAAERSPQRRG
jgi:GTP-binding protein